ncbi:MAG: DUF934 domain-containing protein [Zoogloeaceae bacterium]|jgi:uncharacterized protein (DUF934 family)|nr:DUF934 domain-containing protein [Zoogloeaceae bacterium]
MNAVIRESAADFQLIPDDLWRIAPEENDALPSLPNGAWLYPLVAWQKEAAAIRARGQKFGLWLKPDTPPIALEALKANFVADFALIALDFPVFTDGRAYSLARLLRERLGYTGELRAVGHVLLDTLLFTRRLGFDAWAMSERQNAETALAHLRSLSQSHMMRHPYQ